MSDSVSSSGQGQVSVREKWETLSLIVLQNYKNAAEQSLVSNQSILQASYFIIRDQQKELAIFREWEELVREGSLTEEANQQIMDRLTVIRLDQKKETEQLQEAATTVISTTKD